MLKDTENLIVCWI